jgi:diacylglycerol kinase (ATP)
MQSAHPVIKNEFLDQLFQPKRMAFIVNPKAGTNLQKNIGNAVDKYLNHKRFVYGIWSSEYPGHGYELAKKAVEEGYDIVVAVGGDGSVNEIAPALIGTNVSLGIIPAGSGNGLAMHLGYGRELAKAVKKLNTAENQLIDVGVLNGRPFFNVAGIGFDGLVSNLMKASNWRGFVPYFLKSMEAGLTYTPLTCRIELDDRVLTEKCFVIAIANGPMYGYNMQIAPDAQLDDGFFEVVILKDAPVWQYLAAVPATFNGKIYDAAFVEHFTTRRVVISAEQPLHVHVDGEGMVLEEILRFEINPKAINILVPIKREQPFPASNNEQE